MINEIINSPQKNVRNNNLGKKNSITKKNLESFVWDTFEKVNRADSLKFIENVIPEEILFFDGGTQKILIKLTEEQIIDILRYKKGTCRAPVNNLQVMMRTGVIVAGRGVQFTNLQRVCSVQLNRKIIQIPKKKPINLTPALNIIPDAENLLIIRFITPNFYVIKLFLGKYANIPDLKNKTLNPNNLTWFNKQNTSTATENDEDDAEIMSVDIPVTCPISKKVIKCPCRSELCIHLNCFDLTSFLKLNENKRSWYCPICEKLIKHNAILIDSRMKAQEAASLAPRCAGTRNHCILYHSMQKRVHDCGNNSLKNKYSKTKYCSYRKERFLQKILQQMPAGCKIVTLSRDGSWFPAYTNKMY